MSALTFTIGPDLWISANDRPHWADKAKRTRALRHMGLVQTRVANLRNLGTCHVAAFIGYPRNGKADPSNAFPTCKALIDGMTDAGCWPDDDHTNVIGPTYLRDPSTKRAGIHTVRFVMTSQEVPW